MPDETGRVLRFPFSRLLLSRHESPRDLGPTALTRAAGNGGGAHGHWCSRCRGIWYLSFAEVECPVCGNRHG